jgi:hypothetical protein
MLVRERFVRQAYMQELRAAGDDQNEPGANGQPRNGGYNRGYAAIATLFPGSDWAGDVKIGNSRFRTMSATRSSGRRGATSTPAAAPRPRACRRHRMFRPISMP